MDTARFLTISRLGECLCVPIKASKRLKYNSVAVSSSLICLGTNTGSTYVFDRETFKLIKFISSKGGSIDLLKFSKDGKLLAVADSGVTVTCIEIDEDKHAIKVVKEIEDHKGVKLTCLCWDDDSARLFIGDERGVVTAVMVNPFKLPPGKFLSKSSVEIIIKGESPIIQLDYAKLKLLISTTTRTLLCLTDKSKYQQVGSKPRDGRFGSCFLLMLAGEFPVIYSARPGSRLWEVDFNGQVLATHQFKYLLAVHPHTIYGCRPKFLSKSDPNWESPQSVAFPHLQQLCNRYLLTWSQNGLYILDPSLGKVSGWYDEIKGIKEVSCHNESVYVLFDDGHVLEMEFLPVKNCLKTLLSMNEHIQAAQVAIKAREEILNHVESFLTIDFDGILGCLKSTDDQSTAILQDALQRLISELQAKHNLIRSEMQDRMNQVANLDESTTPCDSGVEDNDEVRSNQSEVMSETSSRLSLSRLPQIDMDSVLRRATSAVVSKIVSSGFMKKALQEVLESDVNYCSDNSPARSPLEIRKFPDTRQSEAASVSTANNGEVNCDTDKKSDEDGDKPLDSEMGNIENKSRNNSLLENGETDGKVQSKRIGIHSGKRRKKAKVVTVDFASPQKDDPFTQPAYDIVERMRMKRNLSLGATMPYKPHPELKRLSSLQKPLDNLNVFPENLNQPKKPPLDAPMIPAIFKQAKQLVRNIIHQDSPPSFDVPSRDNATPGEGESRGDDSLSCFLVSQEATKHIPKFVDVTAVCRNKIRDSRVLFSSKTVRKILQDWAEKLNETIEEFSKSLTEEIKRKNDKHQLTPAETELLMVRTREEFFSNLGAAFSEVSNLASLCFETGIFPISCSKLTSLDFSMIDRDVSLVDIWRKVNGILDKEEQVKVPKESDVTQESTPSTLLFLANNYEGDANENDSSFDNNIMKDDIEKDVDTNTPNNADDSYSEMDDCKKDLCEASLEANIDNKCTTDFSSEANGEVDDKMPKTDSKAQLNNANNLSTVSDKADRSSDSVTRVVDSELDSVKQDDNENNHIVLMESKSTSETSNSTSKDAETCISAINSESNSKLSTLLKNSDVNATNGIPTVARSKSDSNTQTIGKKIPSSSCSKSDSHVPVFGQSRHADLANSPLREHYDIPESSQLVIEKRKAFLPPEIELILCTTDEPITCQSCAEDICRACFVLKYFPLLDVHKIRTVLSWKRGCRWRTWLAYLVHLEDIRSSKELRAAIQNNDYGKVARSLRDAPNTESFFSCLRKLLSFSPQLVLDICTEKDINPWEVCFIYMSNSSECDVLDDFLDYVSAMQRIRPSLDLLEDISVAMTTLYCGLRQSHVGNSMTYCDCKGARKGAHLLSWRWKTHINDVISWVLKIEDSRSGVIHRTLTLCRKYGYWVGCLEIYRSKKDHRSAFELLCQLGDFEALDQYVKKDSLSITADDLKFLLELRCHEPQCGDPVNCGPAIPDFTSTITNEFIARIIIREIGIKAGLEMLENLKSGQLRLSRKFYFDCMGISEREVEQRVITMKIMEKLNNEMCNETKTVMDKHIELMKNKELSGSPDVIDESHDDISGNSKSWESPTSNHWGVSLNLSSSCCPCCTLPLCIHGASSSAGLIVFECGHTFHKQCIPEEACLVCYYDIDNFE